MHHALDNLHAHTSVVVWTFPEAGLVVIMVGGAVCAYAPVPFAVLLVYDPLLAVVPASEGLFKGFGLAEMLPDVEAAYDRFGLYPPVEVSIYMVSGFFIDHGTFLVETFHGCLVDIRHDCIHPCEDLRVSKHESGLVDQP